MNAPVKTLTQVLFPGDIITIRVEGVEMQNLPSAVLVGAPEVELLSKTSIEPYNGLSFSTITFAFKVADDAKADTFEILVGKKDNSTGKPVVASLKFRIQEVAKA